MNRFESDNLDPGPMLDSLGPRFFQPTLPDEDETARASRLASTPQDQMRNRNYWESVRQVQILDAGLIIAAAAGLFLFGVFVTPPYVIYGVLIPIAYYVLQKAREKRLRGKVTTLFDLPSSGQQHAVAIRYRYFGIPCGSDTGVLTFTGGLLVFEGRRLSFAIRRQDVSSGPRFAPDSEFTISTEVAKSIPCWIKFDPFTKVDKRNFHTRAFERDWDRWRESTEYEILHSTLPPLARNFGISDIWKRVGWTLIATIVILWSEGLSGKLSQNLSGQLIQIAEAFLTFALLFLAVEVATRVYFANRVRSREQLIKHLSR